MRGYSKEEVERFKAEMDQLEQDSWFDSPIIWMDSDITQPIKKEDKTMDNTQTLLETLTKAIVFKYSDDKTAPGVTVSALKGRFYASIVRYDGAFGKGKNVVCNATEDTLPLALQSVANKFLGTVKQAPKNPIDELGDLVKGNK